jgi:hypothetical protein
LPKFQEESRKICDKRVQLISDIVNGIQVIKLYGWESHLEKQVEKVRQEELIYDKLIQIGRHFDNLFTNLTPFLVSFFTFLDINTGVGYQFLKKLA